MRKLLPICLIACALSGVADAETIWLEDFSSYTDAGITGAGVSGGYPGVATNWGIDVSGCANLTPGSGNATDYFLAVDTSGGRMEARDVDGEAVWSSSVINISGHTNISLSVDTSETGSSANASKYVRVYYRLDGGAETAFETNPTNSGNWGSATATQSNLVGSTVQIVTRVDNPNSGDLSIFDNVTVSGDPVSSGNTPPVLDSIGDQSSTVSNALDFTVTASDADNDPVVLSASNLPPGAVFNTVTNTGSVTGQFSWASAEPVGVYTTTFYAADGTTNDFEEITITVTNGLVVNTPPVLDPIGDQSLTVSNALNFAVTASDADNDQIILSASNLPSGAVFNTVTNTGSVTGQFSWASAEPVGVYTTTFYAADGTTNDFEEITITVTNEPAAPPLTGAVWNVFYNDPQQSGSSYPDQFRIRDALVARIDELQSGHPAALSTFTFSADDGAGYIINAMDAALDRGAEISFIADGGIQIGTIYGGTNSLLSLSTRPSNPLHLVVDGSLSGIMHNKFALFDYGGTNQWVYTASWNHTLSASADQWNIGLEARSPSLYNIYTNETAELLAGRFHDDPNKSHAHDGSTFTLDGSWGTNFVRFAPYPDDTEGGNNAERDITNLIAQAQSEIVFALNKLNREPIRDALVAAADRGVTIRGVMPKSDTDPGGVSDDVYSYLTNSANYATTNIVQFLPAYAKADYSELDDGEPNLIHAKMMAIDPNSSSAVVIHGSANWTFEALVSDNDNDENTLFLRHNEIGAEFLEFFERITGTGAFDGGNSTIIEWDFNDSDRIADGGISANETQTVSRVPAPSDYSYTGNALSCNGWNDGENTKFWEASFSTEEHIDIKVSSAQTASGTGPSDFKLQYKIGDGGTYVDVSNTTVQVIDDGKGLLTRISLPATCENQPSVFLRWIMTSNISARRYDNVQAGGRGSIDDIIVIGTAYNQPPVLDPIGDKDVFENDSLTFTVTASDPIDDDPVIITATNLPTGSVFTNNTFIWNNAVPVGAYDVTFIATDKDGSDSETITITVFERPELLISEIADPDATGGDAFRFVEIYNAGTNVIDLAAENWHLSRQNSGNTWNDIELTGTVSAGETYVIAKSLGDFIDAYGRDPNQEDPGVDGNGDDAYFLYRGGDHTTGLLIDIYGEQDVDGTDTDWEYTDSQAERNENILTPNMVWTASEWTIRSGASTNDMTPGEHGPRPTFEPLEDVFVFLGDDLSLQVTSVNTIRTDVITLSADSIPSDAVFPTEIGVDTVTSTLTWIGPTAGVYTATFRAEGLSGARTESVKITVSSTTEIDKYFYGWRSDSIVKLKNGQFWRNTGGAGSTIDPRLRNPEVTITNVLGQQRMYVESVSGYKTVELIDIIESTVTNAFSGLHNGNIYQLEDGTTWEQIDFENINATGDPVIAWRWEENGEIWMRFLDRYDVVIGTCEVVPSGDPVTPATRIDGWFRGWKNHRVFSLQNGQFWQQIVAKNSSDTLLNPVATITNYLGTGTWRLYVDGAGPPAYVEVRRLNNVTRTAIDGKFYGFGHGNIFLMQNGSWWQQTSSGSSASENSNLDVLIYSQNNTDYLEFPDLGQRVEAKQLDVVTESSITNTFRGLRYAHIYRMANGWDWVQISFENVSSDTSMPDGMVWDENGKTFLVVRDQDDRQIGTCEVIDPWADDDGDGVRNVDEAIAGTSLFDRNDFFYIWDIIPDGTGRVLLRWTPVSGRIYIIEWTPSLTQDFQTLETLTDWTQDSWLDTINPPGSGGFYRIRVRLAD